MNFNAISEDFVQFVWKFKLFNQSDLYTTTGEKIQLLNAGEQNLDSGPDFFNAKLLINDTLWVGTVEIHLRSKEWTNHKHHLDQAYNNVILHVVYEGKGEPVTLENGRVVPTIVIGHRVYEQTLQRYSHLVNQSSRFIPCQGLLAKSDAFLFFHLYQVLAIERIERKVEELEQDLTLCLGDIENTFLIALFKHFGSPLNKVPFEILARSCSLKQLSEQSYSTAQLESYLFGLANLLQGQDAYAKKLANEFAFAKKKYRLSIHCHTSSWKFRGTRPSSFPSIRLAQLAALLHKNTRIFQLVMEATSLRELYQVFEIKLSAYWRTHYSFGKISKKENNSLSLAFKNKLIINVVVPFLFFYGHYSDREQDVSRALHFLEEIRPEKNAIIDGYTALGFPCQNAMSSQALIQLNSMYCKPKRCLDCRLAFHLLKSKKKQVDK